MTDDGYSVDREEEDKQADRDRWFVFKDKRPIAGPGTGEEMTAELDLIRRRDL